MRRGFDARVYLVGTVAIEKSNSDTAKITVQRWLTALSARTPLPAPEPRSSAQLLSELGILPKSARGRLRLGGELGTGAATVVRSGVQISLGREVAVKCIAQRDCNEAALSLLREAWVLGTLEHPNIVPVHDLHIDEAGCPELVLRRIEGTNWGQLFADFDTLARQFGVVDHLEWNLDVLMQVCSATHFAHSRGIIHRDIKPENVMIGRFGEVYLVDWGIALATGEQSIGAVASKQPELAGTPCYMAPEMLAQNTSAIGPHTDVYLLGATLYEILSGYPPHFADTVMEALSMVKASCPPPLEGIPEELVGICMRALEPEPRDRFKSADEMRQAIATFRRHRSSRILTRRASKTLESLLSALASTDFNQLDGRLRAYDLYGECRFGFRVALDQWPENEEASTALKTATESMVRKELGNDNAEAAAALLAANVEPSPELTREVQQTRERQRQDRAEMEALASVGRGMLPDTGRRVRAILALCLGVIFATTPLLLPRLSNLDHLIASVAGLGIAAIIAWRLGQRDASSTYNRRLVVILGFVFAAQVLIRLGAMHAGLSVQLANQHEYALLFTTMAIVCIALEPKLAPAAVAYTLGFLALLTMPGRHRTVDVICHSVFALNAVLVWWGCGEWSENDSAPPTSAESAEPRK